MKWTMLAAIALLITATGLAGDAIIRGEKIAGDATTTPLSEVLENPAAYSKSTIVTEGVVETVCQNKGCWMQVKTGSGSAGMRVRFKDYGFFVPKDSKGMKARMQGVVQLKKLSKEDADHLDGEGAKLSRNPDGTATEASFVASGVELSQADCH
jgi:hypothetical protein